MLMLSIGGCGIGFGYSSYPTEIHFGNDQNSISIVNKMERMERFLARNASFGLRPAVPLFFAQICLLAGIALIVYAVIRSTKNSKDESFREYCESVQPPAPPPVQPVAQPVTPVAFNPVTQQVVRRRPLWLILLASFIFFLIGSVIAIVNLDCPDPITGLFILSFWASSLGLFILYIILRVTIGNVETRVIALETASTAFVPVTQDDITFKRIVAGMLGILLGSLGVHKFYLGFVGSGLIMFLITMLSCGILFFIPAGIGFIEGILYLLKSDRDFYRDYEVRRRNWF
jgi:TM2 domain-containing membrane protein YozV